MTAGPLRIHAVAEATGVPATTLRAWERRYGVPAPGRTASAYRLYEMEDIAEIERMRELAGKGIAAAQAAEVVVRERAARRGDASASDIETSRQLAIERIVRATVRMDADALDRELSSAAGTDDAVAFDRIVGPALIRVGELWKRGEISVAHEHLVSDRVATYLRSRLRVTSVAEVRGKVLLACFPDEQHGLALLAVALRFAVWGYRAIVLGPRTPAKAVADAVRALEPDLVGLSVTIAPEARRARALVAAYAKAVGDVPWLVGGAGASAMTAAVEAAGGVVVAEPIAELYRVLRSVTTKRAALRRAR
jgi:DNA-binding transcriptional MerR regulator/methylmalonyl-CoA mutase cobalamin-binding subunit